LKPSKPDFVGYEDVIDFDEDNPKRNGKGWGHFLDVINR
jgi:hypothetical protein